MSYKTEFGFDFDLGLDLSTHPYLNDKSYRNDDCPSFYFSKDGQYYIFWVDFFDKNKRENENVFRYTIQLADNEGTSHEPEVYANNGDIVFENEILTVQDIRDLI
jgi:hypothetical protein